MTVEAFVCLFICLLGVGIDVERTIVYRKEMYV